MANKPKPKQQGKLLFVSPKAHELASRKAFNSKPRLTIREFINILLGLSKDE